MHCQISPRRACNPCGYTMKMSSRYHRLLIYDVKRITKIDGMGPFNKESFDWWMREASRPEVMSLFNHSKISFLDMPFIQNASPIYGCNMVVTYNHIIVVIWQITHR